MNFRDLEIMARTIWGEARGEPYNGQVAVGDVIMNRTRHPKRWANTVRGVCRQKWQFATWLDHDAVHAANKRKMLDVTLEDESLRRAVRACLDAYDDDITEGSDHYYADTIEPPPWTKNMTFTRKIGHHLFFRS